MLAVVLALFWANQHPQACSTFLNAADQLQTDSEGGILSTKHLEVAAVYHRFTVELDSVQKCANTISPNFGRSSKNLKEWDLVITSTIFMLK